MQPAGQRLYHGLQIVCQYNPHAVISVLTNYSPIGQIQIPCLTSNLHFTVQWLLMLVARNEVWEWGWGMRHIIPVVAVGWAAERQSYGRCTQYRDQTQREHWWQHLEHMAVIYNTHSNFNSKYHSNVFVTFQQYSLRIMWPLMTLSSNLPISHAPIRTKY